MEGFTELPSGCVACTFPSHTNIQHYFFFALTVFSLISLACFCFLNSSYGLFRCDRDDLYAGVGRPVLTPHLLRAMYHHLSLTERKLRPPTQLRTSSSPSPSTWDTEIWETKCKGRAGSVCVRGAAAQSAVIWKSRVVYFRDTLNYHSRVGD